MHVENIIVYNEIFVPYGASFGYDTKEPIHTLLGEYPKLCFYDIDHMDVPTYILEKNQLQ